jgi:mucolipin 3
VRQESFYPGRIRIYNYEMIGFILVRNYNWNLTLSERMKFLNLWYVMISINDCLIIMGSIINGLIETTAIVEDMWNICR